jgi:hypothetical protein
LHAAAEEETQKAQIRLRRFAGDTVRRQVLVNSTLDQPTPLVCRVVSCNSYEYAQEFDVQDEMMGLVMQFGYIVFFSTVFPLAAFACFVANTLNLMSLKQEQGLKKRSVPSVGIGIGIYLDMLEFLSNTAIAVNIAIAYFTSHDTRGYFYDLAFAGLDYFSGSTRRLQDGAATPTGASGTGTDEEVRKALVFAFIVVGVEHFLYVAKAALRELLQEDQRATDAKQRINTTLEHQHLKEARSKQAALFQEEFLMTQTMLDKLEVDWGQYQMNETRANDAADRQRAMHERKWAREQDRINKLGDFHTKLDPLDHRSKRLANGMEVQLLVYPDDRRDRRWDTNERVKAQFRDNVGKMR